MSEKEPRGCSICDEGEGKYRCGQCRVAFYCSVACFKLHRNSPSCEQPPAARPAPLATGQQERGQQQLGQAGAVKTKVTEGDLARLWAVKALRDACEHKELQQVVRAIVAAEDPAKRLQFYIAHNRDFADFVQHVTEVVTEPAGR